MDYMGTARFIAAFARINGTVFFFLYLIVLIPFLTLMRKRRGFYTTVAMSTVGYLIFTTGISNTTYLLCAVVLLVLCASYRKRAGMAAIITAVGAYPILTFMGTLPLSPFMLPILGVLGFRGWTMVLKYDKKPTKAMAYLLYLPIMILGPIQDYERFSWEPIARRNILKGGVRILMGLSIMAVVMYAFDPFIYSPLMAGYLGSGIASPFGVGFLYAHAIRFFLYLFGYFSFVMGASTIIGVELDDNFPRIPYLAKSIKEFWRTWNATITRFFVEYVYIPIGGRRRHRALNITLVFVLSGLWHWYMYVYSGSGYVGPWFVVWGLYNAAIYLGLDSTFAKEHIPHHIMPILITTAIGLSWLIFGIPLVV